MAVKKMKKKTLMMILDATIRTNYRWYLRRQKRDNDDSQTFSMSTGDSAKVDGVKDAAVAVYDDVVNSLTWNDTLVKAVESVDFDVKYVTKVIRTGLKSGAIQKEAAEFEAFMTEAAKWIKAAAKNPGALGRKVEGKKISNSKLKTLAKNKNAKKTAARARFMLKLRKAKKQKTK